MLISKPGTYSKFIVWEALPEEETNNIIGETGPSTDLHCKVRFCWIPRLSKRLGGLKLCYVSVFYLWPWWTGENVWQDLQAQLGGKVNLTFRNIIWTPRFSCVWEKNLYNIVLYCYLVSQCMHSRLRLSCFFQCHCCSHYTSLLTPLAVVVIFPFHEKYRR